MGMPTVIFGKNPKTGELFIDHSVDTFGAYCGAVYGQDGWGAMNVSFGFRMNRNTTMLASKPPSSKCRRISSNDLRMKRD